MGRHRAVKPTGVSDRARFVVMWLEGVSIREIAVRTGISVTTVYRWLRRWQREGTVSTRPRSGRPRMMAREGGAGGIHITSSQLLESAAYAADVHPRSKPDALPHRVQGGNYPYSAPSSAELFNPCKINLDLQFAMDQGGINTALQRYLFLNDEK